MNHPLSAQNTTTIFGQFNANALTAMRLMDKVRVRLLCQDGLLQNAIKSSKLPDVRVLIDIKDFYNDNPGMMRLVLGNELMDEILKF